ncbi:MULTISPECIES: type VII secretion target [Actinoplanes]|uniref:type VII secretion target n=1 Tax=Actinoplanes TaxID=1865 RepID=UPI0005F2EC3E|nr:MULTISPECIES: type VII secretion target [Actinoplanes]
MADVVRVDPEQLRQHVTNLAIVRERLVAIRAATVGVGRDDGAYGTLCSWLPAVLETRLVRQEEIVGRLVRNLSLCAQSVSAAAAAYERADRDEGSDLRAAGAQP